MSEQLEAADHGPCDRIASKMVPDWHRKIDVRSLLRLPDPVYEAQEIEIGDGTMTATVDGRRGLLTPKLLTTPDVDSVVISGELETDQDAREKCSVTLHISVYAAALAAYAGANGIEVDETRLARAVSRRPPCLEAGQESRNCEAPSAGQAHTP